MNHDKPNFQFTYVERSEYFRNVNPLFGRMTSTQNNEHVEIPENECLGMIQDKRGYDNANPRAGVEGKNDYKNRQQIRLSLRRQGQNYWIAQKIPLIDCSPVSGRVRREIQFRSVLRKYTVTVTGIDENIEQ